MKSETALILAIDSRSAQYAIESLQLIEQKFASAVAGSLAITRHERPEIASPLIRVIDEVADRLAEKPGMELERVKWAFEREVTNSRVEFKLAFAVDVTLYVRWSWEVAVRQEKSGASRLTFRPSAIVEVSSSGTSRTPAAALALADLLREAVTIGERVRMMAADVTISATFPAAK